MPKGRRHRRPFGQPQEWSIRSGSGTLLVLVEVGLAGLRLGEVRERAPEQSVVAVDAVGEDADQGRVEAERGLAAVEGLVRGAGHRQELDLDDVVSQASAVREAAGVATQDSETARRR